LVAPKENYYPKLEYPIEVYNITEVLIEGGEALWRRVTLILS